MAIGRAIIKKPSLILFDEPLSNLDSALRVQMRAELQRLHRELKATVVYVTHDQVEAMTMADRIVVLNKGDVAQQGAPMTLYHQPEQRVRRDLHRLAEDEHRSDDGTRPQAGRVHLQSALGLSLDLPDAGGAVPEGEATLGIRPEHLKIAPRRPGQFYGRGR